MSRSGRDWEKLASLGAAGAQQQVPLPTFLHHQ